VGEKKELEVRSEDWLVLASPALRISFSEGARIPVDRGFPPNNNPEMPMSKITPLLPILVLALGLAASPVFAEDGFAPDPDDAASEPQFVKDSGVDCDSLREKAGRRCNSLHPGDDNAFERCFKRELDPRCK